MKKFSVILASLVLFAGMTFAQQGASVPSKPKNAPASKNGTGSGSASTGTAAPSTNVKKVPASKTKTATPMAKPAAAPAK